MPSKTTEIKAKVDAAIAAMDTNPQLKAKDAIRQFNVLYQQLLRYRKGILPSHTYSRYNKKLTSVQDTAL